MLLSGIRPGFCSFAWNSFVFYRTSRTTYSRSLAKLFFRLPAFFGRLELRVRDVPRTVRVNSGFWRPLLYSIQNRSCYGSPVVGGFVQRKGLLRVTLMVRSPCLILCFPDVRLTFFFSSLLGHTAQVGGCSRSPAQLKVKCNNGSCNSCHWINETLSKETPTCGRYQQQVLVGSSHFKTWTA